MQMQTNITKLNTLNHTLKTTDSLDIDTLIIVNDFKHIIQSFNTMSKREQNVVLHKYIEKVTVNTLSNILSVYIFIQSPMLNVDPILEKVIYNQFLK